MSLDSAAAAVGGGSEGGCCFFLAFFSFLGIFFFFFFFFLPELCLCPFKTGLSWVHLLVKVAEVGAERAALKLRGMSSSNLASKFR